MCGIVGYVGTRPNATQVVLDGLRILEYRGYDSAGYAVVDRAGKLHVERRAECRQSVEALTKTKLPTARSGIGHTRWATHGAVEIRNAHPLVDDSGKLVLAHNGTIGNHAELREYFSARGYQFSSATDTEVAVAFLASKLRAGDDLLTAMAGLADVVEGASCFIALNSEKPDELVCLRVGSAGGLVAGKTANTTYIASDAIALADYCDQVSYLETGQLCVAKPGEVDYYDLELQKTTIEPIEISSGHYQTNKNGHKHYMAKEIEEQPQVARSAIHGRIHPARKSVCLDELEHINPLLPQIRRVVLVGMGTSLHAAELAANQFERWARVATKAVDASEFCCGHPVVDAKTLLVAVTQSGETADTLAAIKKAGELGAPVIAVVENKGTQATRMANDTLLLNAGFEQAVAATKTFVATAVTLLQLVLAMACAQRTLTSSALGDCVNALECLPDQIEHTLALNPQVEKLGEQFKNTARMLYFGRGDMYPIAREGALKMKEVAYIHAEAVSGGEMKHGVNALIDSQTPAIALVNGGALSFKILTNVSEYEARGGEVFKVGVEGLPASLSFGKTHAVTEPILAVLPLQQLAYHTALACGNDPDRPRNLAKTVTVE